MWIRSRKVIAQWLGQGQDPEVNEVAATLLVECDVCHGGHARDECPSIVRPDTLWKTWLSSGTRDRSLRGGDSFDLIADFYARFRGE